MRGRARLVGLLLVGLLLVGAPVGATGVAPRPSMDETLRDVQEAVRTLQRTDRASALELLAYTEGLTRLTAGRVWAARKELRALAQGLARVQARTVPGAELAVEELAPGMRRLGRRLRGHRLVGPLPAGHLDALVARARQEPTAPPQARSALATLEEARAVQAHAETELEELRSRMAAQLRALRRSPWSPAEQHARLKDLRERVQAERDATEGLLEALQQAERALAAAVKELGAELETSGFGALRGKLPMPVEGPVTRGFGKAVDPRSGTVTLHQGLDIRAAAGRPVRAVAAGTVVSVGWLRGYGKVLVVDHGGGYHTVMAHLDAVRCRTGQPVQAGQELATVGDTGSLDGPGLYFEVRRRGAAQDPASWLRAPLPLQPTG